ncbi:MAG: hypothetical protein H0T40_01805, partial [Geodermatophilaceae bacterium]|nr:hypothetical protein [Geodermatophilaceae bacterium]
RADLQAGSLLIAAGLTTILAWFFPLYLFTNDSFVTRIGIWTTSSTGIAGESAVQAQWIYGVPFTAAAALALWAAVAVVRARGRGEGWLHRQLLFTAGAGFLIGVSALQTFIGLPTIVSGGVAGSAVVSPGPALFLIGFSTVLATAALVLSRLAAPRSVTFGAEHAVP